MKSQVKNWKTVVWAFVVSTMTLAASTAYAGNNSTQMVLRQLYCGQTSENGEDEIYLKIYTSGRFYTVPGGHRNYRSMNERTPGKEWWKMNHTVNIGSGATVEVWELDDTGSDDLIGRINVKPQTVAKTYYVNMSGDGSKYTFTVDVKRPTVVAPQRPVVRPQPPVVVPQPPVVVPQPPVVTPRPELQFGTPKKIVGTLRTGQVAVGGETTGVVISNHEETLEVDFGGQLNRMVSRLNGKQVKLQGAVFNRSGVTRGNRQVLKVDTVKFAGQFRSGVVAVGGETTGTTVDGIEVDLGKYARHFAHKNGKHVTVYGKLVVRQGVTSGPRLVLELK